MGRNAVRVRIVGYFVARLDEQDVHILGYRGGHVVEAATARDSRGGVNATAPVVASGPGSREPTGGVNWSCGSRITLRPDGIIELQVPVHMDRLPLHLANVVAQHNP